MGGTVASRGLVMVDEARERICGFLAALMSHPDEGKWGMVLNAGEQRRAIDATDALRATSDDVIYEVGGDELPPSELDLRSLVLELCQPLEHLKAEYERVFCLDPYPNCSPFELDHRGGVEPADLAGVLADLASSYRAFGFSVEDKLPSRPDHIAQELAFLGWLMGHRRLALRIALFDPVAKDQAERCDLARRNFFGDHLAGWVPRFATALQHHPGGGYFEPLGRVLASWVPLERSYSSRSN